MQYLGDTLQLLSVCTLQMEGGDNVKRIVLPLKQHVGGPCSPLVAAGDTVRRGQLIAIPKGLGANIHASYDGTIAEITSSYIAIDANAQQDAASYVKIPECRTKLEAIAAAGVVGAGGAGFPTAVKLKTEIPNGAFIANAAECEPLLAHNMKQVEEHAQQLVRGIKYCMEITKAPQAYIAIKPKHKKAVIALVKALLNESHIDIFRLPDMYPAGDERVIVREVMGIELEPGQLPGTVGACIDNVETIKHIVEAIEDRKPVIDKDVTVSGRVRQKESVFVNVPIGTPAKELLERAGGYIEPHGEIVVGGPQTGRAGSEAAPVTKTSGAFLVAMPFPQETRKAGILICECGGSEERLTHVAESMGAEVVAKEMCKRMVEVDGRYRCGLPGICPGQAEKVIALKRAGTQVLVIGTCSE